MKDKTFLFAYGTLRIGFDIGVKGAIAKDLVFIGVGKVNAKLYDVGAYPGAIKTNDEAEIEGDVFEVLNEGETFKILDDYEGDEYGRALTTVKMNGETEVDAWIYWYEGEIYEHKRIINKDYYSYLTTKGND